MIPPFERFVALRYLRGVQGRSEGRGFLRFITYVAVGGVAVGVAALLLALTIVRGFSEQIEEKIVGFGAHVQVESFRDAPLRGAEGMERRLQRLSGVEHVAPVVQEFALLRNRSGEIDGVAVWGTAEPPRYLADQVVRGTFDAAPDSAGRPGIVLGGELADRLQVGLGDVLTAFSVRNLGGSERLSRAVSRPRVKQFYVAGIYETLLAEFDEVNAFTTIDEARELLAYGRDQVTRFDLMLADPSLADSTVGAVEDGFGFPVIARTIFEVYRGLFAWVNLQESIIPLVIGVIVLVAAFNIIGTLLMIILEKTREIGVLASMGASGKTLRRLFLLLGLMIGAAGCFIGELLALILAVLQQRYELIPLPAEAYYMRSAPIALSPWDFLLVAVVTITLCALAAYVPARVAARIEPIRVIRFR